MDNTNKDIRKTISDKLKNPQWRSVFAIALVFIFMSLWGRFYLSGPSYFKISYSTFIEQLNGDNIFSVTIRGLEINGKFKNEIKTGLPNDTAKTSVKFFKTYLPSFQGEDLLSILNKKNVIINVEQSGKKSLFWQFIIGFLPLAIIIGFWIVLMKKSQQIQGGPGGLFTFGRSKAKLHDTTKPIRTFSDVAGMNNVKKDLSETIEFLKNPAKYKKLGANVPKGILLVGPPGTGKTLLARAVAGEASVPFYSISASEFIEMFVGVGASRVRDMFRKARSTQPSIIFIDEIDAVGRTRGAGLGGGHDEREQTLNQLLSEMDGFEPHEEVVVMAATNRPDVLDPALLRPGRFDRQIVVDRPGWKERKEILEIHVRDKTVSDDVDLESIAKGTSGMTGADLENLTNEAALMAIRHNKESIETADFEEARDRILMGTVREETISGKEKRITAYHEAGHTLVAYELPETDPIHKVTILPRGMAMGATQLIPEEDRHFYTMSYLMSRLSVDLGGRVAEKIVFNDLSTGAQNDLKEATSLAEKMVAQWGMSDKVGPVNLGRGEEHPFLGRELAQPKHYSDDTAWLMDQEIRRLIVDAEKKAEEILAVNRPVLDSLAEELIKEETLDKDEIEKIVNRSKGKA
ncbi:ATP-dependent zinc metalloprotease FtsH [bacterium BMS3Abin07]|nr:ATP-dependent zinc metalloprotease FtsH [bacterium BMS3Abin07]GBE32907.1 ATP-dependent zinc metalloprotease FtsH [bacterium BMS3Bbin05]HDO23193.1 ATP-dependent metallopeptidase FtsH/Yme1/Tma family protein [Nitrospirota bacterium]HDZ87781.1 ATP-dependent metallopeptidase FtsH/Yme1/Tma family protein [Nitrospirota bacterium]